MNRSRMTQITVPRPARTPMNRRAFFMESMIPSEPLVSRSCRFDYRDSYPQQDWDAVQWIQPPPS